MKRYFVAWCALLLPLSMAVAEIVSASSDPFTFPATQGVKQQSKAAARVLSLRAKTVSQALAITWSVPASVQAKSGTITVYSLQGKTLGSFSAAAHEGVAAFKPSGKPVKSGVYIVKLTFGTAAATIKYAACK